MTRSSRVTWQGPRKPRHPGSPLTVARRRRPNLGEGWTLPGWRGCGGVVAGCGGIGVPARGSLAPLAARGAVLRCRPVGLQGRYPSFGGRHPSPVPSSRARSQGILVYSRRPVPSSGTDRGRVGRVGRYPFRGPPTDRPAVLAYRRREKNSPRPERNPLAAPSRPGGKLSLSWNHYENALPHICTGLREVLYEV